MYKITSLKIILLYIDLFVVTNKFIYFVHDHNDFFLMNLSFLEMHQ